MKPHFDLSGTACMRVHLGLTQQQLANSLGISRSALAMAEAGLRPMPEFAWPILKEMMAIAKKMPAPHAPEAGWSRRTSKVSHNRVKESARLHTSIKRSFVTRQSSMARSYLLPALTKYRSGSNDRPVFSTHLLQSKVECDMLSTNLLVKKDRMDGQLEYLQLEVIMALNLGKEIATQLSYVNTMIQSNLEIIAAFPLTFTKRKLEHRNAKLYCKKLQLEDRLEHFDVAAMLLREHTINVMIKQLDVLQRLIAAVEKTRVELKHTQLVLSIAKPKPAVITGAVDRAAVQCRA